MFVKLIYKKTSLFIIYFNSFNSVNLNYTNQKIYLKNLNSAL